MEWYGRNGRNLWKRVSIKKQAGTIFSAASTNPLQRQKRNSHAECWLPDKPILVRLGCFDDVCMFTCSTSTGYCVLFTAVGQFEAILFVVNLWLSKLVPDDSKVGNKLTVCHSLSEHKGRQDFRSCQPFGNFNIWTAFQFKNSRSLKMYP